LFLISPLAISDCQTQLLIVNYYQQEQELFYDGKAAWDELLNNAQPRQEDDNDCEAEEDSECRCGPSLKKGAGQQENADDKDDDNANKVLSESTANPVLSESTANPVKSFQDEESKNPSWIQHIMTTFYNVLHTFSWFLFVLCLGILAMTIYVSTTLELPTSSEVQLLEDSSQFKQNYLQHQNMLSTALEKAGGSQAHVI
jgi:hypothetical protein